MKLYFTIPENEHIPNSRTGIQEACALVIRQAPLSTMLEEGSRYGSYSESAYDGGATGAESDLSDTDDEKEWEDETQITHV